MQKYNWVLFAPCYKSIIIIIIIERRRRKKKNQFRLKWFLFFYFLLGWGMGFMKAGLGFCEFGILDYKGVVWVCVLIPHRMSVR